MSCRLSTDPLGRSRSSPRLVLIMRGEGDLECCSSAMTGLRPITTSSSRMTRAGCWSGGGCRRAWPGSPPLHELVAGHLDPNGEPDQVIVEIDSERGPWVEALLAAGYLVYAVNPLQVARYRERHSTSGAKSDPGDAHLLAEMVRVDRAHHRPVAGDSEIAEQVKVAARALR